MLEFLSLEIYKSPKKRNLVNTLDILHQFVFQIHDYFFYQSCHGGILSEFFFQTSFFDEFLHPPSQKSMFSVSPPFFPFSK